MLVALLTLSGVLVEGAAPPAVEAGGPAAPECQQSLFGSKAPSLEPCAAADDAAALAVSTDLPPGFLETVVWSGLSNPTAIRFAADGRVFVAEKQGTVKVFQNLSDATPTVFSDLLTNVHNFWDRGLLGLALDPSLTGGSGNGSYVYVLYAYDHILGTPGEAPRWGDTCPTPPGAVSDGCVISGRLSRFAVSGDTISGTEQVLVEDWCQQFPSHTVGSLAFGPDGALYASAGDGASFSGVDYGQRGGTSVPVVTPANPCGDPPGGTLTAPTAEGGALRAQSIRGANFVHASLDGSIIRIDPNTGAGKAGNPFAGSPDANARRIIGYGLRQPFRMTFRPGTNELWLGDVGWFEWEEINRISNVTDGAARNFGWPCYEGRFPLGGYNAANLNLCETLYAQGDGAIAAAVYEYHHDEEVVANEACPTASGSSTTGLAFYPASSGSFPASYRGGLFFADHTRNCIWFMPRSTNGQPNVSARTVFLEGAANPVDITVGPGGDLFYVDFEGGTIRSIAPNNSPIAAFEADPTFGSIPLTVDFDASASSDPDGGPITYAWDLDGDGAYDDGTGVTASRTYVVAGDVTVGLRVTDSEPTSDTASVVINAGNLPPVPVINLPTTAMRWKVGDLVSFSGSATDAQDGNLPASALSWSLILQHCPSACHPHAIQTFEGVASGSFHAPDHAYPSHLELKLTAKDSQGKIASTTRRLDPKTVVLTFATVPSGLALVVNGASSTSPISKTVIAGSSNSVTATTPQSRSGYTYAFSSWSNGLARSHNVVAPATNATYTATYATTSFAIAAKADAYVAAANPNTNYGGSTVLKVRDKVYRSFVKFAVTGLSGPASSAKLRLWVTNPSTAGGGVYKVSNSWTQSTITWNNAPTIGSAPRLAQLGTTTTGTWVEVDVTSAITGNGSFTFRISGGNTNQAEYSTRETSKDPVLIVTP